MRFRGKSLLTVVLFTGPLALLAQAPPFGGDLPVSTYVTGNQLRPAIVSGGDGRFVVVWDGRGEGDTDGGIFGRGFGVGTTTLASQFRINTDTSGLQSYPSIARSPNGEFLVVWNSPDGSDRGVYGRRFDDSGLIGSATRLNSYTTGFQDSPAVAVLGPDKWVVVWQSEGQDGSDFGIVGQRFQGSFLAKDGPEFRVNTTTTGRQDSPSIAAGQDGSFTVVWDSIGQDGSGRGVFAQHFDSLGTQIGPEFQVNTYTTGNQRGIHVGAHRTGFLVTWVSHGQDGSGYGIFGQRFDASASKVGPEFRINTYTTGNQDRPSAAFDARGEFVVVWQSGHDGSGYGVFGQRFDRGGGKVGAEFQVTQESAGSQISPRIAHTEDRDAVVSVEFTGSGSDVRRREERFSARSLAVDARSRADTVSDANGVLEPGETVLVEPTWGHYIFGTFFQFVDGALSSLAGPAGGIYLINDGTASYVMQTGINSACRTTDPDPCYVVTVGGTRPATHWDATAREDFLTGFSSGAHFWKIHIGDSFSDVPRTHPFYRPIETIFHEGITSGCAPARYCPSDPILRDQMAIFVAKGIAGLGEYVPTHGILLGASYDCSAGGNSLFTDVSPTDAFCKHVHYLGAQNVMLGCAPLQYCPGEGVNRGAMASFVAKAAVAPRGGAAVPATYTDPVTALSYSCEAAAPDVHFTDVPASHLFCKHIHYLWAKGFVSGCSPTQYCPDQPVTRDAMAKFLANGFALRPNGP